MNLLKMLSNVSDANVPVPACWQKYAKESIMKNQALKERKSQRQLERGSINMMLSLLGNQNLWY